MALARVDMRGISMRPKAIVTFERLGLLSIVLSSVQILRLAATGRMSTGEVAVGAGGVLLSIALVLLASRRRSRVALWVLSALTLLGVVGAVYQLGGAIEVAQVVDLIAIALQATAVTMAWTKPARAWFSGRDAAAV